MLSRRQPHRRDRERPLRFEREHLVEFESMKRIFLCSLTLSILPISTFAQSSLASPRAPATTILALHQISSSRKTPLQPIAPPTPTSNTTIDANHQYSYGANVGWMNWLANSSADGVVTGECVCSGWIYAAN